MPSDGSSKPQHLTQELNQVSALEAMGAHPRLKKLLEADDSEAAEFIVEAQNSFSAVLSRTEIETLTRMVGDFDYESALRAVSGIADRLSLKLE